MRTVSMIAFSVGLTGCIQELPDLADPCAEWPDPGLYKITIETDQKKRKPYVWVPKGEGPRDIAVVLHGGGQNKREISDATNHIQLANAEGMVAVFPDGLKTLLIRVWSAGTREDKADDVAFLEQLVTEIKPKVCGANVMATGFSNGGMMAQRWACEGKTLDAVVPAAGPLEVGGCSNGRAVPIRYYHGTNDDVVPIGGGSRRDYNSAANTMATWRERNQCTDAEPTETVTGKVTCEAWDCEVPTEFCTVAGWPHRWPGGSNAAQLEGADATKDGWAFFQAALRARDDSATD